MTPLLLIGGGGHCRSAIDVIETEGRFQIKGILQRKEDGTEPVLGYPIMGDDAVLPSVLSKTDYVLITVGQIKSPAIRRGLFERLSQMRANVALVVSPKAHVSRHAQVGLGTLIMHGAIVNAGSQVGDNCIVNTLALVEHDATVGEHSHISTGARVNGGVRIEPGCFIGSGAVLREGVRIGANSVIGAGCIVKRDVEPGSVVKE